GHMPDGSPPPLPPELQDDDVDEIAEYTFNLVTEGYVDPATAAAVTFNKQIVRTEGPKRTIQTAFIAGWAAAVELIAAELHARLDEMLAYLAAKAPPVPVLDEAAREYLAYVRFNASAATARTHADHLAERVKPWVGTRPTNNRNA